MKNARNIVMQKRRRPIQSQPAPPAPRNYDGMRLAASRARMAASRESKYDYPIKPPTLAPGVVPANTVAPVMAMDARSPYEYLTGSYPGGGFPGFAYLSQLATRAEYRAFASSLSTELTREWIEFTSQQEDEDQQVAEKIKLIEAEFKRLDIRGAFQRAAEHDCYFGRAQFFIDIKGADAKTPLILDPRTVPKGSLVRVSPVEAMWTTPSAYNSLDPAAPDFYKPTSWFMLGREVHASRLLTVVTRPLPDMLKPAFNFAGMSLSQLAEPYVDNWLRTRQSVSDLINNFSITAMKTRMDQLLQGEDDGDGVLARADFFTATRSNKGIMLLDMESEELVQVNTPLSGLHELQAQSQEHLCAVSRMPAIILTGISPSGLNASSEGEIRVFYDWIAAQQEAFWRAPLEIILQCVQLSLFGEIDFDIGFRFVPLYQMTPKEAAEIREADCRTATAYINAGVLDPSEERERIARDPDSGYHGLDLSVEIVDPNAGIDPMAGKEDQQETSGNEEKPFAQDAWITVKPNGPDSKGTPVEIGEGGEIKHGMGGKFNGQKISEIRKDFTGPKSHEARGRPEPVEKKELTDAEESGKMQPSTTQPEKTMNVTRTVEEAKKELANIEKEYDEAVKQSAKFKQYDRLQNEGGEGFSVQQQKSAEAYEKYMPKIQALKNEIFRGEWTPEVTAQRRAAWNEEMQPFIKSKRMPTGNEFNALAKKMGFNMTDLKRAIAMHEKS